MSRIVAPTSIIAFTSIYCSFALLSRLLSLFASSPHGSGFQPPLRQETLISQCCSQMQIFVLLWCTCESLKGANNASTFQRKCCLTKIGPSESESISSSITKDPQLGSQCEPSSHFPHHHPDPL
ncbi:hypothetical protein PIB30_024271 [Stylosanthes scabra]|uniref:Secreted protein n=1 Tax=Stylosanthes scabra TaxID=79078 RepID=A0ABU6V9K0_9FABA|nr:hypothetical protein [Stylosanthes scabra]